MTPRRHRPALRRATLVAAVLAALAALSGGTGLVLGKVASVGIEHPSPRASVGWYGNGGPMFGHQDGD